MTTEAIAPVKPRTDAKPRCWHCRRLLAEQVSRPWAIRCGRCKKVNARP